MKRKSLTIIKTFRGIRVILYFLFLWLLLPGNAYTQQDNNLLDRTIQLTVKHGTIQDFISILEQNHGVNFSYNPDIIPSGKEINLSQGSMTVDDLLRQLFLGSPVKYTLMDDLVILSKRNNYTIKGFVENKESGERLIGATLYEAISGSGTVSNNYGFYSLTVPEGEIHIEASYVGYKPYRVEIILEGDTTIHIGLEPGLEIQEVFITSDNNRRDLKSSEISIERLSAKTIDKLPTLLGEGDVLKMMQYLPGVQLGSEASTGIVVRGGSPEQNLILLDGAPVYNSNHAFGLFSVFNSDAIKNLSIIKGGFPARYGGRLSSVVDVRLREGNIKEYCGNVNIGTIASKFTLEGPVIKDKSSFIVSARRTYVDLLLPKKFKEDEDFPAFYFYDINAKINYRVSKKDRLFLSTYIGHDRFYEEELFTSDDRVFTNNEYKSADWGNITFLARWNHVYNKKLFSNLSLIHSKYGLVIDVNEEDYFNNDYTYTADIYKSGINDLSASLHFDYYPVPVHKIKFGLDHIYHTFNPGIYRKVSKQYFLMNGEQVFPESGNADVTNRNDLIYANETRLYFEDDFLLFEKVYLNAGLHLSGFLVDENFYSSIEPRISASYPLSDNLAVKSAYSRMKQYLHLLTHSSMGLPTDLWMPVTSSVKPQYSNQYTLGMVYFIEDDYKLSLESYYKTMHQIYAYREGVDYLSADNTWEGNIEMGYGSSYGLEFMLRKFNGKLGGWVSYTWSKTDRQFDELNDGRAFPYKYDRTHQVNMVATYAVTKQFSVNATWIYATGMAYSLPTEKYSSLFNLYRWNAPENPSGYIHALDARNNKRMPAYHRLDGSVSYTRNWEKLAATLNFSIYNIYNRFNPYLIYWDEDMNDGGRRKIKQVALFSVIPSLSLRIDF